MLSFWGGAARATSIPCEGSLGQTTPSKIIKVKFREDIKGRMVKRTGWDGGVGMSCLVIILSSP